MKKIIFTALMSLASSVAAQTWVSCDLPAPNMSGFSPAEKNAYKQMSGKRNLSCLTEEELRKYLEMVLAGQKDEATAYRVTRQYLRTIMDWKDLSARMPDQPKEFDGRLLAGDEAQRLMDKRMQGAATAGP